MDGSMLLSTATVADLAESLPLPVILFVYIIVAINRAIRGNGHCVASMLPFDRTCWTSLQFKRRAPARTISSLSQTLSVRISFGREWGATLDQGIIA